MGSFLPDTLATVKYLSHCCRRGSPRVLLINGCRCLFAYDMITSAGLSEVRQATAHSDLGPYTQLARMAILIAN